MTPSTIGAPVPRFGQLTLVKTPILNLPNGLTRCEEAQARDACVGLKDRVSRYARDHAKNDFHQGVDVRLRPVLSGERKSVGETDTDTLVLTSNVQITLDDREILNPHPGSSDQQGVIALLERRIKDAIRSVNVLAARR